MKRPLITSLGFLLIASFVVFGAATALKKVSLINQSKCIKCGTCFKQCPVKAISKIKKQPTDTTFQYLIDPKKCIACGLCNKNCPTKAISWANYDTKTGKIVMPDSAAAAKKTASSCNHDSAPVIKKTPAGK